MRILGGKELLESRNYMFQAAKYASLSGCLSAKCGAIIVANGIVIGTGYNSPPGNQTTQQRCMVDRTPPVGSKHDHTCCVHAEWRAVLDAVARHPDAIADSTIYFTRVDAGDRIIHSGKPYCTVCSRIVLDVGISRFVLWHEEGMTEYDTVEYNDLSYAFKNGP
jgi:deoxycytidylate deaminase